MKRSLLLGMQDSWLTAFMLTLTLATLSCLLVWDTSNTLTAFVSSPSLLLTTKVSTYSPVFDLLLATFGVLAAAWSIWNIVSLVFVQTLLQATSVLGLSTTALVRVSKAMWLTPTSRRLLTRKLPGVTALAAVTVAGPQLAVASPSDPLLDTSTSTVSTEVEGSTAQTNHDLADPASLPASPSLNAQEQILENFSFWGVPLTSSSASTGQLPNDLNASDQLASTHVVVTGDCLWTIASRYSNLTEADSLTRYVQQIYEINRDVIGEDPNIIHPGQTLTVPPFRS
ncbi:MAG: LysM domain-containing protein [Actinomycetaceae bacterium]|nr:LysM domain-containing protein [Actinomycetaceae bacterium]